MAKKKASKPNGIPPWVWIALVVVAAGIAVVAFLGGGRTLPDEVSAQQAAELRDEGAFVLDVREPDEWARR